jgi:Tol biopolymer transport system component
MRRTRRRTRALTTVAVVGLVAGGSVLPTAAGPTAALAATALAAPAAALAAADQTTRVSVATGGGQGDDGSFAPAISADGRFVAFTSFAGNLVPGDAPFVPGEGSPQPDPDVFVHDRQTHQTARVSVASDGSERNDDTPAAVLAPAISADGRQVAFVSEAAFDPADTDDGGADLYVHDRVTGRTALVSPEQAGLVGELDPPSISGDGRRVAYQAQTWQPTPGLAVAPDTVFLSGGESETVQLAAVGGSASHLREVTVERDGEPADDIFIDASACLADPLPPGATCELTLSTDTEDPSQAQLVVSDDGAGSPHLVDINPPSDFTGFTEPAAAPAAAGPPATPTAPAPGPALAAAPPGPVVLPPPRDLGPLSSGGVAATTVAFTQPTGSPTAEVRFRTVTGALTVLGDDCDFAKVLPCQLQVQLAATGTGPWWGAVTLHYVLNPDSGGGGGTPGTVTAFVYARESVTAVLVTDRDTDGDGTLDEPAGTVTVGVPGPDSSRFVEAGEPSLSADGRFLAFSTEAGLVPADTSQPGTSAALDTYRVALDGNGDGTFGDLGAAALVSVTAGGVAAGGSGHPSASADGHAVAFASRAGDVLPGDGNDASDVFVRDLAAGRTVRASVTDAGVEADGASSAPSLAADGHSVAFVTDAANLGASGTGGESPDTEVVLRDLVAGSTVRISTATGDRTPPGTNSVEPTSSADGRAVAFAGPAPLVTGDTNDLDDVFVRDRPRPGLPGLAASPNPVRFPTGPLGVLGPARTVILRATGPTPIRLGQPALSGPDAKQYTVDARACAGRTLAPGASCQLAVRLRPGRVGGIRATLLVPTVDIPGPLSILLTGAGAAPTLQLDPAVGPPGTVVRVTGTGFPPGGAVALGWAPGLGGESTTASGTGTLDEQLLVLRRDQLGGRDAVATASAGVRVTAPFLVVPPGAAPPRFINTD